MSSKISGQPRRIIVDHNNILQDVIPIYKDPTFDPTQSIRVTFQNQPAIDGGGPKKEMYSLTYQNLVNSSDYKMFEGPTGRLMPFYNAAAVFSGMMKTLGIMLVHSIVQCGIGLPVFSPVCYWYLITGDVSKALPYANVNDIRDERAAVLTKKIIVAETDDDFNAINNDSEFITLLSDVGCTSTVSASNRSTMLQSILMHFVLNKKKVLLDQMRDGLKTLGFLEEAVKCPLKFERFFVKADTDLTSDDIKAILEFPDLLDEDERRMKEMLLNFLDDCSSEDLQNFLRFTTGAGTVPMVGSPSGKITVSFDAVEDCIFSSTCLLLLQLPHKVDDFDLFNSSLRAAITSRAGLSFNVV